MSFIRLCTIQTVMTTIRDFNISFPLTYEYCANLFNVQDYFNDRRGYPLRETPYSSKLGNKRKQLGRRPENLI